MKGVTNVTMSAEFIDFLVQFGISGVAFACFYLIHKSSTTQFEMNIQSQKQQFDKIIDSLSSQMDKQFEILKQMIDQNNLQLAYLQEIKTLVSANLWCPYVKEHAGVLNKE